MSTVYSTNPDIPADPSSAQQSTSNSYMKWGGIGVGILVLFTIAGACGDNAPELQTITETITTTAATTPTTVTTTARTTVTETANLQPETAVEENTSDTAGGEANRDGDAVPAHLIAPAPAPEPAPVEQARPQQSAYYANCSEARAAGAAPLYKGDPGYRSALDRDNDGIACE